MVQLTQCQIGWSIVILVTIICSHEECVSNCISAQLVFWFWLNPKKIRFQVLHFYHDPLYGHIVVCRTLNKVIFYCPDPFWKGEQK